MKIFCEVGWVTEVGWVGWVTELHFSGALLHFTIATSSFWSRPDRFLDYCQKKTNPQTSWIEWRWKLKGLGCVKKQGRCGYDTNGRKTKNKIKNIIRSV